MSVETVAPATFSFFVPGMPVAKGSMKAFKNENMRFAVVTDSKAKRLKPWEATIGAVATEAACPFIDGPVTVGLAFGFPRPKNHYGTGKNAAKLKPSAPPAPMAKTGKTGGDIDKLSRAALDALAHIAYRDDSQVVVLWVAKRWADPMRGPGVFVTVGPCEIGAAS